MGIIKRFLCVVFVFSLLLTISACSKIQKNNEEHSTNTTTVEHTVTQTGAQKESNHSALSTVATTKTAVPSKTTDASNFQPATETAEVKTTTQYAVQNSAVNQIPFEIPTLAERTAGNLELTVKESHAGDKTINANITDYDNQGFVLDLSLFELEKYNGTKWINITDSTIFSNASNIFPQNGKNATIDFRIFVSQISKQPLEQGTYRLKGTVSGYVVSAEFEVLP